jgi:hypothetical protein
LTFAEHAQRPLKAESSPGDSIMKTIALLIALAAVAPGAAGWLESIRRPSLTLSGTMKCSADQGGPRHAQLVL